MIENEMWFYCFCDECQGCMQHDLVRRYCKLCKINQTFTDFEEVLRENKYNTIFNSLDTRTICRCTEAATRDVP